MNAPSGPLFSVIDDADERVEALRYAMLRKLAPGLRHALMGDLQAVQLSAELASRLLRAGGDPGKAGAAVAQLPAQCGSAIRTSRSLMEWLRPDDDVAVAVNACIGECLKIVGDDWFLRGIDATLEFCAEDVEVARTPLRELVVAALLVLTDLHDAPLDLHVKTEKTVGGVRVRLSTRPAARSVSMPAPGTYRKLGADDLALLSSLHGIPCAIDDATITLEMRLAAQPAPTPDSNRRDG